jgi:hypothetical protein
MSVLKLNTMTDKTTVKNRAGVEYVVVFPLQVVVYKQLGWKSQGWRVCVILPSIRLLLSGCGRDDSAMAAVDC